MQRPSDNIRGKLARVADRERGILLDDAQGTRDAASFGAFRTPVLTLRPDAGKGVIKTMTPDILAPQIAAGFGRYLLRCAKNLGDALGFKVPNRIPKNTLEVNRLLDLMRARSKHGIRLFKEDDGTVHITHGVCPDQGWDTYFIPVLPSEGYRPALKELTQRFIKTLEEKLKIGDISDQPNFDYILEVQEEMKEEAKERPGDFDETDIERFQTGDAYRSGGYALEALHGVWKKDPVTRKDIESFRFRGTAEQRLKEAMLHLMGVIEEGFDIWNYSSLANPFTGEFNAAEIEKYDGYVPFNSICTVIYDYDTFLDEYLDFISNDMNAGYETEYLVGTEELTPDSTIKKMDLPGRFLSSLEGFISAMNASDLQNTTKHKHQNA